MKLRRAALAALLALSASSALAERVVFQAKPGLPAAQKAALAKSVGGRIALEIPQIGLAAIELPAQASARAAAALLARDSRVAFAEPERSFPQALLPNDPKFASAWHLPKISAPAAWDTSTGSGTTIAILDSGVDAAHPDLAASLVPGYNFYDNNSSTADANGHGTAVAGAAAAISNNAIGVAGVAGSARIMPMRIASPEGYATGTAMAQALTWAADHGARVANLSFSGIPGNLTVDSAAQYFRSKGGVVIAAAANTGAEIASPAQDSILFASATDANDAPTSFSSYGAFVDFSAPGINILSTARGGGYGNFWGTSFSAPISAGVAALAQTANPALAPSDIDAVLTGSAKDLGDPGFDVRFGHGRIDAAAAVAAAKTAVPKDTALPSVSFLSPASGAILKGLAPVSVSASDNVGVARVELSANGALVGTDFGAPFEFVWDTASAPDGAASLQAKAFDAAGNASSVSVSVKVQNSADLIAPAVRISAPLPGPVLSAQNSSVKATASDNVGVVSMAVLLDGSQIASSASGSVSAKINLKKLRRGSHSIEVRALDASGNLGTQTIQVTY